MLSLQESVTMFVQENAPQAGERLPRHHGASLFRRVLSQGWWRRLLKRLAGQPVQLRDLSGELQEIQVKARYAAGVHSIRVDRIRGSEGRSQDFDSDFTPLNSNTEDRWIAVAAAALADISLPPVDLIQLGELYYVRDGHHRVSVARALGQKAIDAQVTVLEV